MIIHQFKKKVIGVLIWCSVFFTSCRKPFFEKGLVCLPYIHPKKQTLAILEVKRERKDEESIHAHKRVSGVAMERVTPLCFRRDNEPRSFVTPSMFIFRGTGPIKRVLSYTRALKRTIFKPPGTPPHTIYICPEKRNVHCGLHLIQKAATPSGFRFPVLICPEKKVQWPQKSYVFFFILFFEDALFEGDN